MRKSTLHVRNRSRMQEHRSELRAVGAEGRVRGERERQGIKHGAEKKKRGK